MKKTTTRSKLIKPSPVAIKYVVTVGTRVHTPYGPGHVRNLILGAAEHVTSTPNKRGYRLLPPHLVVELEQPWEGETHITLPLQSVSKKKDDGVLSKLVKELWPDQVSTKPAQFLRPTVEPGKKPMKISEMIRRAKVCSQCGETFSGKGSTCPHCQEEAKGDLAIDFVDPQGTQYWTKTMLKQPSVYLGPTLGSKRKIAGLVNELMVFMQTKVPKPMLRNKAVLIKWLGSGAGKKATKSSRLEPIVVLKFVEPLSDRDLQAILNS